MKKIFMGNHFRFVAVFSTSWIYCVEINKKNRRQKKMERNEEMNEVIKELSRKYNKKEKSIKVMFDICIKLSYNVNETISLIQQYLIL